MQMVRSHWIHVVLYLAFQFLVLSPAFQTAAFDVSHPLSLEEKNKIALQVWEDTFGGQKGKFLVVLNRQVDVKSYLSGARHHGKEVRLFAKTLRKDADDSQSEIFALLKTLGARFRSYWIVNVIAVEGDRMLVETLAKRQDVKSIESNRPFPVPLERPGEFKLSAPQAVEWNISWVNAPAVWALGFKGQNRVYANADSGVQWGHPALKPQYRGWNGVTADHNYHWWDAVHADLSGNGSNPCGFNSSVPCDDNGHGTHTIGIGIGDDGGANQIGIAPGARWISCRNMEEGYGQTSTYIECLQFFLAPTDLNGHNPDPDKRPDAIGNSYSCSPSEGCSADSLKMALENLRAAGVFIAASAGNTGSACSSITNSPGLNDAAITVGATGYQTNTIASFSGRGPVTIDGSNRRKPDLVAPGMSVRSSYPTNTYTSQSGTSIAVPHVAGAALLLWSAFPQLARNVDQTELILTNTAQHLTTTQACGGDSLEQVPNNVYGYGQIDVQAAYHYALSLPPLVYLPLILK